MPQLPQRQARRRPGALPHLPHADPAAHRRRRGLHSRPDHGDCEHCHIEHQGRDFELVYWGKAGQKAFDHALAGYTLQGAHAPLECRACHRKQSIADPAPLLAKGVELERTFLGLETRCASCHKDAHRGQFGTADCASCHGLKKFRPAELFDHDKSKFPLTLAHVKVACARCHPTVPAGATSAPPHLPRSADTPQAGSAPPDVAYRGVPTTCAGCHKDPHQGRFGAKCESCHTSDDWKRIQRANFDHARTRYPLTGKHQATDCLACHLPGKPRQIPGFERCASCHADAHAGQLARRKSGGECGECHTTSGFRPSTYTVALHEATSYPLLGSHRTTKCATCHRTLPPAELERAGIALVRVAPAPKADRTAGHHPVPFPEVGLRGLPSRSARRRHREVPREGGLPRLSCAHRLARDPLRPQRDEVPGRRIASQGRLPRLPQEPGRRRPAPVEVGRAFPLPTPAGGRPLPTSAAVVLPPPSARAWATPREVRLAGAPLLCSGCHADPHLGQVGTGCEKCHGDSSWGPSRFDHNRDSTYRLEGAHRAVACVGCHFRERIGGKEVARLKPVGSACADCHKSAVLPL